MFAGSVCHLFILSTIALIGCSPSGGSYGAGLPCIIAVDSPGVVLEVDTSITLSEPGYLFARDGSGNIFGAPQEGGAFVKWSPSGKMLARVGVVGEGPGEFALGSVIPYVAPGDTLYLRDNHLHWVVYGPDLHFVRNANLGPILATQTKSTVFAKDGLIYSSNQRAGPGAYSIVAVDHEGVVRKQLAAIPPSRAGANHSRPIALADDGSIWVGPEIEGGHGYEVEHWAPGGTVLRRLVREVSWFQAPRPPEGTIGEPQQGKRAFPFPRVSQVVLDSAGLLWVTTDVPRAANAKTRYEAASPAEAADVLQQVLERRIEVFRVPSGVVLAAYVFDFGVVQLPGSRSTYQAVADSDGRRIVTFRALHLQGRAGTPCGA